MLSCSSFGLLVLRVSLHDVRDFYMRLMMQGNSPRHENEDAWWKILVPAAVIGVGVALLPIIAGSSSISAHSPESQTPTAAKSEVPKETSNKAVPEKKMLAATGASVMGLVLAASLLMFLGLVLVLKRRKES
ncbi:serine-aspartate repeat-containing protein D [Corynebacterium diphtheriae bv. mitis]|nr:hypothetical protein CDPW8_0503 [Corynebacterium diphtheriae PW8]OKY24494.1 hypothetical protein AO271_00940 [Corynebacterium diphtheriae]CAB0585607.1 LPXTG cell wall anchor domain-containing protein [Corynebacterium diphtheriae]SUY73477.1 serine-aspartate repeat-containing protein D [Corynebacterium diphtheriae bv. mitis]